MRLALFVCLLSLGVTKHAKLVKSLSQKPQPEQVHLSYNGDPTQMVVTWLSMHPGTRKWDVHFFNSVKKSDLPYVKYSQTGAAEMKAFAAETEWKDGGKDKFARYTYRAMMANLTPGRTYNYIVGSDEATSNTLTFKAMRSDGKVWDSVLQESLQIRAAVFGDLSKDVQLSAYEALLNYTRNDMIDIVFHIGDIAYNMDDGNGAHGDEFMRWIEPVASAVPYMVIAGNHEEAQHFLHFESRFTMPPNGIYDDSQFWSFDIANMHFIGLSSEYYGFEMDSHAQRQYTWLENDLKKSSGSDWIFYFIHRPMYCSNTKPEGCQKEEFTMTRNGVRDVPGLEKILNKNGVDMGFWGHRHIYERFYPVYRNQTFMQNEANFLNNSPTTVYLMNGAGVRTNLGSETDSFQVDSATVARTSFVPADRPDAQLDRFVLTKSKGYKPGRLL